MYLRAVPWVFSRLLLICIKKAQNDKANWKQMKTKAGLDFLGKFSFRENNSDLSSSPD